MLMLLPPCVGDEDFYRRDVSTVYEVNCGMPLPFCLSLLDSALGRLQQLETGCLMLAYGKTVGTIPQQAIGKSQHSASTQYDGTHA